MMGLLPVRVRRTLVAAFAALLTVAGIAAVAPAAQAAPHAGRAPVVDVMTRNLYLGADLNPVLAVIGSTDPSVVIPAASQVWAQVVASDPAARMGRIADEIVAEQPDLVGLQEVTLWTYCNPVTQADVGTAYDFLQLLTDALAARGAGYTTVTGATSTNFTSPCVPVQVGTSLIGVRLVDRDMILSRTNVTRSGLTISGSGHGTYTNIVTTPLPVARGFGWADVATNAGAFRFVNTHLEAFGGDLAEPLRLAQAHELVAAMRAGTSLPLLLVGDYNSQAPSAAAYAFLASQFTDAWVATNPGDPGFSCCQAADLRNTTSQLDQRIDLVLADPALRPLNSALVGDQLSDRTASGLWPSDHAGVVAKLKLTFVG